MNEQGKGGYIEGEMRFVKAMFRVALVCDTISIGYSG